MLYKEKDLRSFRVIGKLAACLCTRKAPVTESLSHFDSRESFNLGRFRSRHARPQAATTTVLVLWSTETEFYWIRYRYDPSSFVTKLSYSLVGVHSLSNPPRPPLPHPHVVDIVSYSCQHWFYVVFVFFQGPAVCSYILPFDAMLYLLQRGSQFFFRCWCRVVVKCCYLGFHPRSGGSLGVFYFFFKRNWSIPVPSLN